MEGGLLQKVVLAHHLDVQVHKPFHLRQSLQNLRRYYPDCYLFCWANAQGTNFMGASPERLLRLQQQHLQTEALAGSVPRGSTPQESRHFAQGLLTNPKERHEHQLVVDFIVEQLQILGIYPQRSGLPKVRQLSHIQHLLAFSAVSSAGARSSKFPINSPEPDKSGDFIVTGKQIGRAHV